MENLKSNLLEPIGRGIFRGIRGFLEANLTIPTCFRKLEEDKDYEITSPAYMTGVTFGFVTAFPANVVALTLAHTGNDIAQVYAGVSIGANILSGLCEVYRYSSRASQNNLGKIIDKK